MTSQWKRRVSRDRRQAIAIVSVLLFGITCFWGLLGWGIYTFITACIDYYIAASG